jgi:hypothetical protein
MLFVYRHPFDVHGKTDWTGSRIPNIPITKTMIVGAEPVASLKIDQDGGFSAR